MKQNIKIIIFCAPSGSGKTTIARAVVSKFSILTFTISAVTRAPRGNEKDGVDYYFLSVEEFKKKIANNEFAEWVEVYPGIFYGTLKSEIERINNEGNIPVADIDVIGAQKLKAIYGENALVIFVKAPPKEVKERLEKRKTDTPEAIATRIARIPEELKYEEKCDVTVNNIDLEKAIDKSIALVTDFLETSH